MVSVYGQLAPLLWAPGKIEHHDREHVMEQSSSHDDRQEAGRKKRQGTRYIFPGNAHSDLLPLIRPSYFFTTFQ
jgi:hypothetical protein